MKKKSLETSLCMQFCTYYKPGKKEELACRGYTVVERLMQSGKAVPANGADKGFDHERAEPLVSVLCRACDFHIDGCDFMLDREAAPCGGFVLLARLLEDGIIAIGDI